MYPFAGVCSDLPPPDSVRAGHVLELQLNMAVREFDMSTEERQKKQETVGCSDRGRERGPGHHGTMLECDRRQGKRTFQDMTLLWVLLLTATLAGHVYSDDYDYTAGGDAYGDPARALARALEQTRETVTFCSAGWCDKSSSEEAEGSDYIAPTEDTALTTVSQPGKIQGLP
ncbi:hypothetical protein JZ751_012529 [Albula glossodonta]|uniref:Uncharacterized protein n=1 Tax=Albula glossodonta TaxID=121402 RepID=A0A8T2P355_9TELE|nr:hypothetical protein JZ751_012529 [Albula glossodonta]